MHTVKFVSDLQGVVYSENKTCSNDVTKYLYINLLQSLCMLELTCIYECKLVFSVIVHGTSTK